MKNIQALKGKLFDMVDDARALLDTIELEKRSMTPEEKKKHNKLIAEIRTLENEIADETELQKKEGENAQYVGEGAHYNNVKVAEGRSYREMFGNVGGGNFRSMGEFFQVVNSGKYDPRLDERQHLTSPGESGGFAIPTEHAGFLLDKSLEAEIVRPRAKVYPMQHSQLQVAKWNNSDHQADGLYGGLQGVWVAENAVNNIQEGALELITLEKRKLAIYTEISNELAYDSNVFEQELGSALRRGIGWYLDHAFINGGGAGPGQPVGVLNDPALIDVVRNTPGTVDYDDLTNMFAALYKGGRAVWMVSDDLLPDLMQMQDPANRYIWQPNAREGVAGNLFGYPVIMSEKIPADSILLVDWSHYLIGLGPDITIEKNNAPGWSRDVTSFRCIVRADGVGSWSGPHTAANGNVYSWCVALD